MSGKKAKAIRRAIRREIKRADVRSTKPRWMPRTLWDRFIKRVSLVFKPQPSVKKKQSKNHKKEKRDEGKQWKADRNTNEGAERRATEADSI